MIGRLLQRLCKPSRSRFAQLLASHCHDNCVGKPTQLYGRVADSVRNWLTHRLFHAISVRELPRLGGECPGKDVEFSRSKMGMLSKAGGRVYAWKNELSDAIFATQRSDMKRAWSRVSWVRRQLRCQFLATSRTIYVTLRCCMKRAMQRSPSTNLVVQSAVYLQHRNGRFEQEDDA
jgi:hypothetical protein